MSQPPTHDTPTFTPPRWVSWLIALTPIFPPLYLAAFGTLKHLRQLPLTARRIVFFFAATQLVAAIFTPAPLTSLGLTAVRTAEALAMIAAGVYLRDSRTLRPLLWGQLVIFASAWGYTLYTQGVAGVQARLGHPYYYIVTLGLVATIALWLIVYWRGAGWWRWPAGLFALATLLASGSRGPLLALLTGSVAALAFQRGKHRRPWLLLPVVAVIILAMVSFRAQITFKPIERLLNDQTSGREFVWQDAVHGWQTSPLGGVGPYQGGPYLTYLFKDGCQLTPTLERNEIHCPESLIPWAGALLIAHNVWLHWLLETGIIGTLGLLTVTMYGLWLAVRQGDSFTLAIMFGYLAINMVDVVLTMPSVHFSELWWLLIGVTFNAKK
ncbi:O-antigen ligase family protein [Deinococcus aquiradiocola]|uniref:O-antigen ligase family protein n=1 Tax=Deinococcus aquiradiocola TaxID=393059 RepID=UPI001668D681|nr:O-antigen ligase family protein [Deinococcus aquiradiocola]